MWIRELKEIQSLHDSIVDKLKYYFTKCNYIESIINTYLNILEEIIKAIKKDSFLLLIMLEFY